jgi:hypothetical protein
MSRPGVSTARTHATTDPVVRPVFVVRNGRGESNRPSANGETPPRKLLSLATAGTEVL